MEIMLSHFGIGMAYDALDGLNIHAQCLHIASFLMSSRFGNNFLILVHKGRVGFFALLKGRGSDFLCVVLVRTCSIENRPVILIHCLNHFNAHASVLILLAHDNPLTVKVFLFQTIIKAYV